MEVRKIYH
jgi:hypothetical protein